MRFPVISGLVILAFRGIVATVVREIQFTGCADLRQDVRRSMRVEVGRVMRRYPGINQGRSTVQPRYSDRPICVESIARPVRLMVE